jgi:hypothetical protein
MFDDPGLFSRANSGHGARWLTGAKIAGNCHRLAPAGAADPRCTGLGILLVPRGGGGPTPGRRR